MPCMQRTRRQRWSNERYSRGIELIQENNERERSPLTREPVSSFSAFPTLPNRLSLVERPCISLIGWKTRSMICPLERFGPTDADGLDRDESANKGPRGQNCTVRIDLYRTIMRGMSPSKLNLTLHRHCSRICSPSYVDEPHCLH